MRKTTIAVAPQAIVSYTYPGTSALESQELKDQTLMDPTENKSLNLTKSVSGGSKLRR